MKCEACGKVLHGDILVLDIAISITTAGQVEREENEWNADWEGYICHTCWLTIPEKVREALT